MPVGAEIAPEGGVHFRVWAPRAARVDVKLADRQVQLDAEARGLPFRLRSPPSARERSTRTSSMGVRRSPTRRPASSPPDPTDRRRSSIRRAFPWTDDAWPGITREGQVLYELHVGTFTTAGTWEAASRELPELARLGITVVELMPVADFVGEFGWGYDGVDLFAPTRLYGRPDEFRAFVDRAHAVGLGVILDVVYNHLGSDGNYLGQFASDYFSTHRRTDWGPAINFDGPRSGPVREFFAANAGYWIEEFHLDGLRLDATQEIYDDSPEHVLTAVARHARQKRGPSERSSWSPRTSRRTSGCVRPVAAGGYDLDALWNDDFHHTALVAISGRAEAYYSDHAGTPQELISAVKRGYLYQGQHYAWQRKPRGSPAGDLGPTSFVNFIQNHDQIANSLAGKRGHLLTSPGRYRAMTALLLLGPATPMLFQGQEFAATSPFLFFADVPPELAKLVRAGRAEFLAQFPSIAGPDAQAALADPADSLTFERSKLDLAERERHGAAYALHLDLLRLRKEDPVFRAQGPRRRRRRGSRTRGTRPPLLRRGPRSRRSAALPQPWAGPRPRRRRRATAGATGGRALAPPLVQRGASVTAAVARPISTRRQGWRLPGHAAVVFGPAR